MFGIAVASGILGPRSSPWTGRASLNDGGRVAVLEFVPSEDRLGELLPAGFALTMLAQTAGGDAYAFSELASMLHDTGFTGPPTSSPNFRRPSG